MKNSQTGLIILIIVLGAAILASVFYFNSRLVDQPKSLETVKLQLKWRHQAQFAGFYAADQLGYYADQGLQVEFTPGGPGVDVQQALASGAADFSIMGGFDALLLHNSGEQIKVTQSIYQVSPNVFISPAERGIDSIEDFEGQKIGMGHAENTVMLNAMMHNKGLDPTTVTEVKRKDTLAELVEGKYDITAAFVINELMRAKKQGLEMNVFLPADYGVDVYGDVLVTTDALIGRNTDLVRRFNKATRQGWEYVIENPEEAAQLVTKYNPDADLDHEEMMMMESLSLLLPVGSHMGHMESAVWDSMANLLLENQLIETAIASSDIFTTRFIKHE